MKLSVSLLNWLLGHCAKLGMLKLSLEVGHEPNTRLVIGRVQSLSLEWLKMDFGGLHHVLIFLKVKKVLPLVRN